MLVSRVNGRRFHGVVVLTLFSASIFVGLFNSLPSARSETGWWDPDWQFREMLTINHSKIREQLSSFPVMLDLNSSNLDFSKCQTGLEDIRFTDYYGNPLPYEIEMLKNVSGYRYWSRVFIDDNRTYTDGAHNIVPYDIDGDGNLEFVTCSYRADSLQFYKYYGNPEISSNWIRYVIDNNVGGGTSSSGAQYVAIADINGDGRNDLILAEDQQQEDVVAYLAPVDRLNMSAWQKHVLFDDDTLSVYHIEVGDVDGDGDVDISMATRSAGKVGWLENTGALDNWPATWIDQTVRDPFNARIGDFDQDGKGEIACNYGSTSTEEGYMLWYDFSGDPRNPANWVKHTMASVGNGSIIGPYDFEVVDIDRDGNLDIIVSNVDQNDMYLLENPYPGNVSDLWSKYKISDNRISRESGVGDIDGDGDLDIVGADEYKDTVFWLENPGNPFTPNWKDHVIDSSGSYLDWTMCAEVGDINKDGTLDVACAAAGTTTSTGCTFQWYVNSVHEPEKEAVVWVKLPSISNVSDTDFYMYYGNPSATDAQNPNAVWDSGFKLVQHLEETAGTCYDSTANHYDGTPSGGLNQNASGKIDGAYEFDGTDDCLDVSNDSALPSGSSDRTLSVWVKVDTFNNSRIFSYGQWSVDHAFDLIAHQNRQFWIVGHTNNYRTVKSDFQTGVWYNIVAVLETDQLTLYWNGIKDSTQATTINTLLNNATFDIGRSTPAAPREGPQFFNGTIDEVQFSNVARSEPWISASYENQNDPSTFYTIGPEETAVLTRLYIDPPLVEKVPSDMGTTFKENVTIENVTDLWGFDINITWNEDLIKLAEVDFNNTLDQIWGHDQWFAALNESGPGWYELAAVALSTGYTSQQPKTLAIMEFQVEATLPGETPIHFDLAKLSDSKGKSMPKEVADAVYRMLQKTMITLSPDPVEKTYLEINTCFNVSVTAGSIMDLFGFDFNLTWNDALIAFHKSYYYDTLNTIWGDGKWQEVKDEAGTGWYKFVALSTQDSCNITGTQPLFIVEFMVKGPICNSVRETAIHFETHKLSDSLAHPISHVVDDGIYRFTGQKPALEMSPVSVSCRKYDEHFKVTVNVTDACNVEDFELEIRYNTTLLDYVDVTWITWAPGTITVDETNGNMTLLNFGTPASGQLTLFEVEFRSAYHHIWKNLPNWANDLTGGIFFQWANLSYTGAPDLGYVKGGALNQINVGQDVDYTFAPIQGDVDNNGVVDVFDLRTVAIYYDVKEGDPGWPDASKYDLINPTEQKAIDVYDLSIVGGNFGYVYTQ